MLTLITGVPGSGKSLFAVSRLQSALAEGRPCYADVDGLKLTGVHDSPRDWRDCPDGSFVVYDEAQGKFPSTGRPGRPDDPVLTDLEVHRHRGFDLIFITQSPTMIHHHIRKLVGEHVHVQRAAGAQAAVLFRWGECQSDPQDRQARNRADKQTWRYPKQLYSAYDSATVHTHKFRMPRRLIWIAAGVCVAACFALWMVTRSDIFSMMAGTSDPPVPATVSDLPAVPPLAPVVRIPSTDSLLGSGQLRRAVPLSTVYRLAGTVIAAGRVFYFLAAHDGRSVVVPSPGYSAVSYSAGILVISGPAGGFAVTAQSGPAPRPERPRLPPAAGGEAQPPGGGSVPLRTLSVRR